MKRTKRNASKIIPILMVVLLVLLTGCSGNVSTSGSGVTATTAVEEDGKFRLVESDGTEIVLDKIPERIVVLSVATAEIMHALDIPLVGMCTTSREISEGLRSLPDVGIPMTPDMERIAALNPDLVIMSTNFKAAHNENFQQFGINVFFINNQRYTDTENSIRMLAEAFGKEDQVDHILAPIKAREEALIAESKGKEAPRVMVLFGSGEAFSMARSNSFAGEMVSILGAENITDRFKIDDELASMMPLSIEQAVEANPQVIFRISHGNPRQVQRLYNEEFANNSVWNNMEAVKNGRVYDLSTELFFANPGLTAIDSLEELSKLLFQ